MDIAALSIAMNEINTSSDVGVAMLSKSLDVMEDQGEGMKKMMEASVYPYLGQNVDYSI
jgi:hypothetical protein